MKLEMTRGCIADWLGADGILEREMDEETRAKVYDKIIEFLKKQDNGLNQLLQFVQETYGDYDYDEEPCETCGDTVENWVLELPDDKITTSELKDAINEGFESGIAEDFDPDGHLEKQKESFALTLHRTIDKQTRYAFKIHLKEPVLLQRRNRVQSIP